VRQPTQERPSYVPTILVTLFFGLFGLIPAILHARMARERGYETSGYWISFVVTIVGAAVVVVGAAVVPFMVLHVGNANKRVAYSFTPPAQGPSKQNAPATSGTPGSAPTATTPGSVDVSQVSSDPNAPAVAQVFGSYFSGIDTGNYIEAYSTYSSAEQAHVGYQSWANGLATSNDTEATVNSISENADGSLSVDLQFTSHQSPQYGPDPGETCTNWTLSYQLTPNTTGPLPYLINSVASIGAGHQAC
jgi:hypothetical protein